MAKRVKNKLPVYNPTPKQTEAYMYCVHNAIRVSFGGTTSHGSWTIDINTGKGWHKSPNSYESKEAWDQFYRACEHYYNKSN